MPKVLVTDDVADNVLLLKFDLEDDGYDVVTANSGMECIERARDSQPDVILLDLMMPELDGYETCRRLKDDPQTSAIPVILVSARDDQESIVQGLDSGAHDYTSKPYNYPVVAARLRAAVRMKQAWDAVELLNAELAQERDRAEAAARFKAEFLANMGHEIRTPMSAIVGFTDLLLDAPLEHAERVESLQTIRRNCDHLLQLINDILDLSKIEAGKMTVETIPLGPEEIVDEVFQLLSVRAKSKGLALERSVVSVLPPTLESDLVRIRQVLINLVGNAIKFTESGSIEVEIGYQAEPSPTLWFDVIDTGRGMTAEQSAGLFEAFAQAERSTTREFGGTGLGLNISRKLAVLLGGRLELVNSELGVGSRFRFSVAAHGIGVAEHDTESDAVDAH